LSTQLETTGDGTLWNLAECLLEPPADWAGLPSRTRREALEAAARLSFCFGRDLARAEDGLGACNLQEGAGVMEKCPKTGLASNVQFWFSMRMAGEGSRGKTDSC